MLQLITGPSGCGKGTVVGKLLNQRDDTVVSVSCTTRKPREGEIEGVHYFYKSREEFEKMIAEDAFLEHAEYSGNCYGTPKSWVDEQLAAGRNVILEIDVQGGQNIMKLRPDALSIFMLPPSLEVLEARLIGRNSEPEEIVRRRMETAIWEISQADTYQYQLVNDDLQTAVDDVNAIIEKENH